jgi:hypothetical protein
LNVLTERQKAFRLAFQTDDGLCPSQYGYICPQAAETAAPMLNRTRFARGRQAYTHVIEFHGAQLVEVRQLEAA